MQMASASCGEKLLDVIFKLDFGMHSGPIMRGADEGQEKQSVLETDGAEQPIERVERFGSVGRLQENVASEGEKSEFHLRSGRRNNFTTASTLSVRADLSPEGWPSPIKKPVWRAMQ